MVVSTGASGVILGHSERRQYFGETDELIKQKCLTALKAGLQIILCVGEKLEDRESGTQEDIVRSQLDAVMKDIPESDRSKFIIAYEPVWAIGTGKTASPEQADEMHNFIRDHINKIWPVEGEIVPLLYGGSCNPGNAAGLFSCKNIDGGLIGGASLKSRDFTELAKILANNE
jgi:triosephosphate isomerase (TIM)